MAVSREQKEYIIKFETQMIVKIVLFALLLILIYVLRDLVLVLLTAIVIASFIESVVKKLEKFKVPRTLAVISVYIISLVFIIGVFYVFVPILISQVSSLVQSLGDYIPKDSFLQSFQAPNISSTKDLITDISSNASLGDLIKSTQSLVNNVSGGFVQTASIVFGGVLNVVLIAVITFYLSVQEHGIQYFLRVVTPIKHEEYIIDLWKRTERKIGLWMQGQMMLGILIGVMLFLGLSILGVKYSLVIAAFSAIFELIPFGIILAGIVGIAFAYIDGGMGLAFKVFLLFWIVQQFENYLIAPLIVNKVIGVSPLVVILSVLIGAKLAGLWGVLLAIPVAVCLLEYLSDVEKGKSVRYTTSQ
jgi:predicted PurR-regulated permease PerM